MDKIITALDYAKRAGVSTVKEHIILICKKMGKRLDTAYNGEKPRGEKVKAEIDFGRWIARCPDCNGAEDVDPTEPIFYCFSCGNYKNQGYPRPVEFPEDREKIEKLILQRPVKEGVGANELERAVSAQPTVRTPNGILSRSWLPGETVADLKEQNKPLNGGA